MAAQELALDSVIATYRKELRRLHIRPQRVLLFGSWARGSEREGSDVDLVIISSDFKGKGLQRRLELLGIAAARALVPVQALGYTPEEVAAREPGSFLDDILSGPTTVMEETSRRARPGNGGSNRGARLSGE